MIQLERDIGGREIRQSRYAALVVSLALGAELLQRGARELRLIRKAVLVVCFLLGVGLLLLLADRPGDVVRVSLALLYIGLAVVGLTTVALMLYAWRDDAALAQTRFPPQAVEPELSFSLIVPARHEQEVLSTTLAQLRRQDHPAFQVIVVIGQDDPDTRAVAEQAISGDGRFSIVTDFSWTKNKPRALNNGLRECSGDIVGIFDAEDIVAPTLLRSVDQRFRETGADVVQGATQLMNYRSSWFAVRNVLEYYFWFKSRLHFHARNGFIPLGGNTVFIRRKWLDAIGGWDERCLAEDCELGCRLSTMGAKTVVSYTSGLATREETPETLRALVRQRTRWNQGYLQVLRKGDWRVLPFRQRLLAAYTLAFPFLHAALGAILPLAIITMIVLPVPILLALLSFIPAATVVMILAVELVGLREFGLEFETTPRVRDYARLVFGVVPYQIALAYAACRAAWREMRGVRNWEKTAHLGAHL